MVKTKGKVIRPASSGENWPTSDQGTGVRRTGQDQVHAHVQYGVPPLEELAGGGTGMAMAGGWEPLEGGVATFSLGLGISFGGVEPEGGF